MNEIEAVASLLNQPLPQKLTKAGSPELSELVQTRILEQANKQPYTGNTRLPYMTYDDLADSDIYDPTDFHTVGNLIRNNVAKAITERFPVVGEKYTLKIENLAYEKQKNRRLADEKAILQQEKSLMDRLRGDWVLIDNATGKEVERKSATILNVPRMTERGTFIRNGSELGLKHMFRLKPGIYARVKGDGTPSVHINPAQTTGRQMSLNMDQSTGIMSISRGTRTYGVLPLLRAAGVTDDEMKAAWGEDLFNLQKNKYVRILANDAQMAEYKKLWDEGFAPIKLDPETTMSTMGKAYSQMSPEVLLGAANKAVKLSRSMSVEDEDDRDSLAYQRIMGPADYIPERIVRDGGGLLRKMFQRVVREGNLKSIESGAFQPQVDSVFMEDKHAGYIDGASPFEGLDFASGVSRIGEGGIGDIKAAPAETRGVNDSYLGFIDPIRSPECSPAGSQIYTKRGWKNVEDLSMDDELACLIDGKLEYHKPLALNVHDYNGPLYGYESSTIAYRVTPNHRIFSCSAAPECSRAIDTFDIREAQDVHLKSRIVMCGGHGPIVGDEDLRTFKLPFTEANLKSEQVYGNPPLGANLRNVCEVDIDDFAEFLGWYLSEGCFVIDERRGYYRVEISQHFNANPDNYRAIRKLLRRLPFNAYADETDEQVDATDYTGKSSLCIGRKQLTMYCAQFGKSEDKFIPDWIFSAPLSARIRFRDAMLKGDARDKKHYTSKSKRLAMDFARLQFELGESVKLNHEPEKCYANHPGTWVAYQHSRKYRTLVKGKNNGLANKRHRGFYVEDNFSGKVYCPTVPGGLVFFRGTPTSIGFWCGNSLKVGLEVYLTYGVRKDSKGNLYANFIDKSGKTALRPMGVVAKSIVATPEYYDPSADPEEFIPAFNRGKGIEYIKRKDVDFFLANSNNMMSVGAGMIPNIGGIRSNRTLMGCLHPDTELDIIRGPKDIVHHYTAKELLTAFQEGDQIIGLDKDGELTLHTIRQVVKIEQNTHTYKVNLAGCLDENAVKVSADHKWLVKRADGSEKLITTAELITFETDPYHCDMIQQIRVDNEDIQIRWFSVGYVEEADDPGYLVDIDVDDNLYMLGNGMFTHNSKYPLQALSLKHREAPLVQRELTADGEMSTTERRVAKQLGAKFSPVDGRVIAITDDEMVIRDREGTKHTVDLYNMYPANQKGYLHNTPSVQVGDRVKANQLIAESNYTKGDSGALGTNLKMAFISGHGAELFEDAIAISESAAKKLASEQMHKFRGDLSSDTAYDKQRFISLFGDNDYTQEQLDKIDENGMPKIGVEFKKGDPVFLGIQIRDLSTSGLSRNASVPYVKTWEHDAPGKVIDVVKGRKHMTVYTRSFTPMQLGDKLCFDEQTEIMTKRGWILFKDLLADDEVLTLNIRTGDNYFSHYESAFKYYCEKETLYRLTSKRLDIFTTAAHKHVVAPMNNSRYLALQNSEQVFGKHRWFPTSCNIEHDSCFASNREDGAKERWEKYTGWVYCVTVPDTNTVFVRRNGKTVWSGNSNRYGAKGVISCYDSSTYVFTDKGFKPFPELTTDDRVAVLDPKTGKAHFENPKEVQHAPYTGTMYGYQDRNLSWLVTPTHDMWAAIPSCGECKRINVTQIHGKLFGVFITPPEKIGKTVSHQLSGLANVMTNPNNFFTEEYNGTIHCCTVSTGIIYVMRDGKPMWCGNSIIPDNEMLRDENGEPYDALQSPLGLPSRCYDDQTEFLTKDRGWKLGKDIKDTDELYCFDPKTFTGRFDKQIDTFYRKAYKGPMYGVGNEDVDFLVTPGHKMYVSHGKDFYECKVERCYDHYCEFPVVTPSVKYRVVSAFALEWFIRHNYDGYVYCPSVATGYVLTRRNGKQICLGNTNPAQLSEPQLSKVAMKTGKPVAVPDFITDNTIYDYASKLLNKHGLKSSSRVFDPRANKYIDDVEDGYMYYYKLKHMSELKERGRGTGSYSAEEVPMKGAGAARRLGMMETSAVYSGGGMDVLKDAKLIRGQRNDEFWRKYRNGETPDIPGTPLVHKKFFSHLIASGANIERTPEGAFKLSAATDDDIKELTGNRRVEAAATFDSKNMHPIAGGLFDQAIFGDEGDRWGYYELPEPVLNPLMFKPIASILGWTDKELREYLQGARKVDNQFGPESLMKRLDAIDLESELKKAKDVLKAPRTTIQQRDLARKRIRAIYPLLKEGIKPSQLFFTRMPILPPRFRAVTVINGGDTNIAADANFLYKRMIDAADDLTAAKGNLPEEYQVDARESLYNAVNAVVGLMPTDDPKLEAKGVSGLLKWAFGKGTPKHGSLQRKIFGSNLDMGGLGTLLPNSNLTIDQVGIPEESAWSMYEPFVVRELRQNGYSMVQAMREVLDRSDEAKRELLRVMSKRPILVNRAPTLWRYGIQGMYPVLVEGRAIQFNPNVCKVYAADADGDSLTTHVPVSQTAIDAIDKSMLPSRNLLSPQNFKAHFIPRDASNEGLFLASRVAPGKPVRFRTEAEAQAAYDRGEIKIDTPIEIG